MIDETKIRKKTFKPEEIEDQPFPSKEIAKGVRGSLFNTVGRVILGIIKFGQ
ncbi:unnamed protein product, partial [marine sediment metagenome]